MVRFAIIGTGRISDWVLKGAVQDDRFKAVAVCSRTLSKAEEFIASHPEAFSPDARAYDNLDEMLSSPDIDAVYIGTPNSTHEKYTVSCIEAGKHVLCEKPFADNLDQARRMVEAARKKGKALMEAMISTLNPNFQIAKEKIAEIGTVRNYFSSFCQYSTKYDALKQGIVSNSFNPQMGGGALPDVGVYTTYPLVALFGKPLKVMPSMIHVSTPVGDVEVQGSVVMEYPEMTASLVWSKAIDSRLATEISAEGGIISLDEIHICRRVDFIPHGTPASGRKPLESRINLAEGIDHDEYYYEFKEFIDVIESGEIESKTNSLQVTLDNMEIMDMIRNGGGLIPDQKIMSNRFGRIIGMISDSMDISYDEAEQIFADSSMAGLMKRGQADLHHLSDIFIADEIILEYKKAHCID